MSCEARRANNAVVLHSNDFNFMQTMVMWECVLFCSCWPNIEHIHSFHRVGLHNFLVAVFFSCLLSRVPLFRFFGCSSHIALFIHTPTHKHVRPLPLIKGLKVKQHHGYCAMQILDSIHRYSFWMLKSRVNSVEVSFGPEIEWASTNQTSGGEWYGKRANLLLKFCVPYHSWFLLGNSDV